jgi:hypothetical protein
MRHGWMRHGGMRHAWMQSWGGARRDASGWGARGSGRDGQTGWIPQLNGGIRGGRPALRRLTAAVTGPSGRIRGPATRSSLTKSSAAGGALIRAALIRAALLQGALIQRALPLSVRIRGAAS